MTDVATPKQSDDIAENALRKPASLDALGRRGTVERAMAPFWLVPPRDKLAEDTRSKPVKPVDASARTVTEALIEEVTRPKKANKKTRSGKAKSKTAKSTTNKIEITDRNGRGEASSYFEQIVAGLCAGVLRSTADNKELELAQADSCDIKIEARLNGGKERVQVDISWRSES